MTESKSRSHFDNYGFQRGVDIVLEEIIDVYLSDDLPWVVGYSGGKDSTATLQLVWCALQKMGSSKAKKPVHVISTDTLVENPIVAAWVGDSLKKMDGVAQNAGLPISAHRLIPAISDSFWVNLIGRGYPAPRQKFRWCTERLKIRPAHNFVSSMVDKYGETILVLGTRKAESVARMRVMERHEKGRVRDKISPNASFPNSFIFSPIENWTNDDVWMFLLESENPWGHDNMDLFSIYKGATPDNECPMVVDAGTPSCGDSRFGCWVCTLVEKDKSMQAMVRNDGEKEWMLPLMEIRSKIDFRAMSEDGDRHLRDFRRMNGKVQIFNGRYIPGPYKQEFREELLHFVLEAQEKVRRIGPNYVRDLELITFPELEEIRRIWVIDKHELEDNLPNIYENAVGKKYPGQEVDENSVFGKTEMDLLGELCGKNSLQYEMLRQILAIESRHKTTLRRGGVYTALNRTIERSFFTDEEDAIEHALEKSAPSPAADDKVIWIKQDGAG